MPAPERRSTPPPGSSGTPDLSPEEQGRMVRAAALRPMNLIVLAIGVVFAVASATWWLLVLTLATYAALTLLGTRDPILRRRVLGRADQALPPEADVSPERRARWLPRGETREKVEAALVEYRRVVAAIEASDDVTRAVLEDTVPRLHATADQLVDVARYRETAAKTAQDLRRSAGPEDGPRAENLRELEEKVAAADAEISATSEELLDLRAKVVRISLDTDRAASLNASLDELNARLEALGDVTSSEEP